MLAISTSHQRIEFGNRAGLPVFDLRFTACRLHQDGFYLDICDFAEQRIDRWNVPHVSLDRAVAAIERDVDPQRHGARRACQLRDLTAIHVAHLADNGMMIAPRGNFYCGTSAYIVDTRTGRGMVFPSDHDTDLNFISATGGFTPDGNHWLYVCWPMQDTFDMLHGLRTSARCSIRSLDLQTLEVRTLYELENDDKVHQVTASPDGRYIIFACIQNDLHVPYPEAPLDKDPEGFRRSHEAGIKLQYAITIDLQEHRHWRTRIPVPVPSHMEFDPIEPDVFYISAHNVASFDSTTVMLEGPAAICKMRIGQEQTSVEQLYTDDQFFRITQHVPFEFDGKRLIAVTNDPNKLELIDAETMTLWRRAEIFPAPAIDFSRTGNAMSPTYPKTCRSINPSEDGRFIVLESSAAFFIYSVEEDRFLDIEMPRFMPEGCRGTGHTRLAGR